MKRGRLTVLPVETTMTLSDYETIESRYTYLDDESPVGHLACVVESTNSRQQFRPKLWLYRIRRIDIDHWPRDVRMNQSDSDQID